MKDLGRESETMSRRQEQFDQESARIARRRASSRLPISVLLTEYFQPEVEPMEPQQQHHSHELVFEAVSQPGNHRFSSKIKASDTSAAPSALITV